MDNMIDQYLLDCLVEEYDHSDRTDLICAINAFMLGWIRGNVESAAFSDEGKVKAVTQALYTLEHFKKNWVSKKSHCVVSE